MPSRIEAENVLKTLSGDGHIFVQDNPKSSKIWPGLAEWADKSNSESKAAMVAFGQLIAKALAPMKIGVTTLAPGFVETEMAAKLLDGPEGDGIRVQSPLQDPASSNCTHQ